MQQPYYCASERKSQLNSALQISVSVPSCKFLDTIWACFATGTGMKDTQQLRNCEAHILVLLPEVEWPF
jgi:hypothetical protein